MFADYFQRKFRHYAKRYLEKHPEVNLVVVTGSIGKSSAKRAIGTVLASKYRVRMHDETMTTPLAVDLAVLGIEMPRNQNDLFAWLRAMRAARYEIRQPASVDVIIQELAVDRPGMIAKYGKYLHPQIAVVTAVTPEHMDAFGTLDAVAAEELSVTDIAKYALINRDDVPGEYADLEKNPNFNTYGSAGSAEFRVLLTDLDKVHSSPARLTLLGEDEPLETTVNVVGEHSARALAAAAGVATMLEMSGKEIAEAIAHVLPLPGRMNPLRGLNGTLVIDDTWAIDPDSTVAALQTLYQFESAPQRIAIIGSLTNLGDLIEAAYQHIGDACNPSMLGWLVVVGEESAQHLAPLAKKNGCQVKMCRDALDALEFTRSVTEEGAIILVKGGETDLLEEAVRDMVEITEQHHLVRQSSWWRARKDELFSRFVEKR